MIIKNACILDYRGRRESDVLIEDGYIRGLGSFDKTGHEIIDAKGQILMPSFVDLHVHMRDPGFTYKEDLETGARAALKGGYTIINAMANTKPVVDNKDVNVYHGEDDDDRDGEDAGKEAGGEAGPDPGGGRHAGPAGPRRRPGQP